MRISSEEKEGHYILSVSDRVLGEDGSIIERMIEEASGRGWTRIILDFKDLNTMDSVGIGILVSIVKKVRKNGHLVMVKPSGQRAIQLFAMVHLAALVDIFDTMEEAVTALDNYR